MELKLGTAKMDITPKSPIYLAGYAHRKGQYEKVVNPLFLRVFYFEQDEKNIETNSVILVIADLIWWDREQVQTLQEMLSQKYGIKKTGIIFHATHNHSGPQTSDKFSRSLGEVDKEYLTDLEYQLLQAVKQARGNLERVTIERGTINCDLGINRRRLIEGEIKMGPNKHGAVDPEVIVIRFRVESGDTKGILIHYACHPTTSGDNTVTPEFPGVCTDIIERSLDKTGTVGYIQGCCGDIRPALIKNGEFYRGGHEDVVRCGRKVARKVLDVLDGNKMISLSVCNIESVEIALPLPFKKTISIEQLKEINKNSSGIMKEWSDMLIKHRDRLSSNIPMHLNFVKIGEGLAFLTMDAEIVVEYGIFVKKYFSGKVLPLPYSNGMIGYVPTAKQIKEGGYESRDSIVYFGLPSMFSSSIESEIYCTIKKLAKKMRHT